MACAAAVKIAALGFCFCSCFCFGRLRSGPFEGPATVKPPALPVDTYSTLEELEAAVMLVRRVDTTLEAFEEIGRFLAGVSGRKNLIWFSGSFPAGV